MFCFQLKMTLSKLLKATNRKRLRRKRKTRRHSRNVAVTMSSRKPTSKRSKTIKRRSEVCSVARRCKRRRRKRETSRAATRMITSLTITSLSSVSLPTRERRHTTRSRCPTTAKVVERNAAKKSARRSSTSFRIASSATSNQK